VILSNRTQDGVVEILALANDDVASLAAPAPVAAQSRQQQQPQQQPQPQQSPQQQADHRRAAPAQSDALDIARISQMMSSALAHAKESATAEMSGMMKEIRAMRGMMET
jgi:flagellar biosynthesis protein FlhF